MDTSRGPSMQSGNRVSPWAEARSHGAAVSGFHLPGTRRCPRYLAGFTPHTFLTATLWGLILFDRCGKLRLKYGLSLPTITRLVLWIPASICLFSLFLTVSGLLVWWFNLLGLQAKLILLHFAVLSFTDIECLLATLCQASLSTIFPATFCHLVSLWHYLVILAIFQTFSLFMFVMVIYDQWSLLLLIWLTRLRWRLAFFSNKVFLKLRYIHCFL